MRVFYGIFLAAMLLMSIATQNIAADSPGADPQEVKRRVDQAIQDLNKVLAPLAKQSLRDGGDGRNFPLHLPSSPDDWRSTAKVAQTRFLKGIKTLISSGVCFGNHAALTKLFEIERLVYGFGFIQMETLFLQRRAAALRLGLPFHDRYRAKRRYSASMSESPQREMRINAAFDEGRIQDAIKLVPEFLKLCH